MYRYKRNQVFSNKSFFLVHYPTILLSYLRLDIKKKVAKLVDDFDRVNINVPKSNDNDIIYTLNATTYRIDN
jgi:hypothetical protein